MYYDGTHGKESIWNLRVPSRDPYVVGHFNPAVTYAATLLGEIHPMLGLMYICAQMFGGIAGAAFVRGVFGSDSLVRSV
jgi:glycerol uptake facilitator-like aquaporin